MPTLYVMDVPEFVSLAGMAVGSDVTTRPLGDYIEVSSPADRLVLRRDLAEVRPAVWFAALTGGFVGSVARFDEHELWLDAADLSGGE